MWNRNTQCSLSLVFPQLALLAVSNTPGENKSSGAASLSSIPNPSQPRRSYSSCSTLQMHTIRLPSTQASVFTFIKLACFQFEFLIISNKAFIEVSIDLLYIYILIYIIIINELLITVVLTERNSTKTSLKNTAGEILPKRQIFSFAQYPCLHVQLYDPLVLLHTASALHFVLPVAHWSISEKTLLSLQHHHCY